MVHLIRVIEASKLKRKWKEYVEEKEMGLYEEEFTEETSDESASGWCIDDIAFSNSVGNLVLRSFIGFIGGVLVTYLVFIFLYIGVNMSLHATTYICGVAALILCLGCAFSSNIRCYVLLLLPVFFSVQGRKALLAYALFLSFTGPASNMMENIEILSDSLTCSQEMVQRILKQLVDMMNTPLRAMRETLDKVTKALMKVRRSFCNSVMKIRKVIVAVLSVINHGARWLRHTVSVCNQKIGTPFQRCMKTYENSITDCKAKLGVLNSLCQAVDIIGALCYTMKCLDFICVFTEFVSDKVIKLTIKKDKTFNRRIKNLLYVSVKYSDPSPLVKKVRSTIKTESTLKKIEKKIAQFQAAFTFFGFLFSLISFVLIFEVYSYKYKFLCSDQYDNVYISKYIVELDIKRAQMDRETVLPLKPRERKKYAKPTAIRLLDVEKTRIAQSVAFLSLTTFKIIAFLVLDYCLFWVLLTMYEAGYDGIQVEKSNLKLHVEGKGILANFYRSLGNAMKVPENPNMYLTPMHCLPDPAQPDTGRYMQIGFLVILCWLLSMTEAYGLRMRNVVMSHYYPERARERAIWLYNHILRCRGTCLRYTKRQLRRKFNGQLQPLERGNMTQRLFANFPLLKVVFRPKKQNDCIICSAIETKKNILKRCKTPGCQGRYCPDCFETIENVCTICQQPIEYGDISDHSEELDSSEDDLLDENSSGKNPNETSEDENFQTFEELEVRDAIRDAEINQLRDYAKVGDLHTDKDNLHKRLKEILRKQIRKAKKEKIQKSKNKRSIYKQIKLRVKDLIKNIKIKKSQEMMTGKSNVIQKPIEMKGISDDIQEPIEMKGISEDIQEPKEVVKKVESTKCLKENEAGECIQNDEKNSSKVVMSFYVETDVPKIVDYNALKEDLRETIKFMKEKYLTY